MFVRTVVVEVLGTPEVVVALSGIWVLSPGVLVDLEELAGTVGGGCVLNLGHVCENRTPVSTTEAFLFAVTGVVLMHLDGYCVTGLEVALSLSRSGADVAYTIVSIHDRPDLQETDIGEHCWCNPRRGCWKVATWHKCSRDPFRSSRVVGKWRGRLQAPRWQGGQLRTS